MANNYRHHLAHELRAKLHLATEFRRIADTLEAAWQRCRQRRSECEVELRRAKDLETVAREEFRSAHERHSLVRQELGEIQDEFFRNGEEARDWH